MTGQSGCGIWRYFNADTACTLTAGTCTQRGCMCGRVCVVCVCVGGCVGGGVGEGVCGVCRGRVCVCGMCGVCRGGGFTVYAGY